MLKFRETEFEYLKSLVHTSHDCVPNIIWLCGRSSTGKSTLVKSILNHDTDDIDINNDTDAIDYRHLYVDCVFFFTVKDLCSHICKTLDENWRKSASSFVDLVNFISTSNQRYLLVFDHCDHLLNEKSALLSIPQFTSKKASLLIISRGHCENFYDMSYELPVLIQLSMYTEKECTAIIYDTMKNNLPNLEDETEKRALRGYVDRIVAFMYAYSSDLSYIRKKALSNFPLFMEPVYSGNCPTKDIFKLWKLFEPKLASLPTSVIGEIKPENEESAISHHLTSEILPYDSNYILVAAYISSYNPPSSDNRFFVKRSNTSKSHAKPAMTKLCHVMGPKPFPFERLLAILYAIHEDANSLALSNIMTQISTLIGLKLLARNGLELLDCPKFICLARYEFVQKCARKIDFELDLHLYDFAVAHCTST